MTSTIGFLLLLGGLLGAVAMLLLAFKSVKKVYDVKCLKCKSTTQVPQEPGEYLCSGCGEPIAKVTKNPQSHHRE